MGKIKGLDLYVEVNTGTQQTPIWTKVGGQTDASIDLSGEGIDVTDKDSQGWAESLVGINSGEISLERFVIDDDVGFEKIQDAVLNHSTLDLRFRFNTTEAFRAMCRVSKLSLKAPLKEGATTSLSFSLVGPLSVETITP